MGEVYRAKDTRLGREVAIKVLPSHLSDDPDLKARFEREARAISQLTHPHICTLHDVGSENGVDFLVMELLDGQSLADRLEKGALPPDQVLKFGMEIADALDRAHRAGIIHRDLKPGNVMLTRSGVQLLDFGLAKTAAAETPASDLSSLPTQASRPLTEKGTVMGTFQYMAPEQLEGKAADARTDIFSFGCVLYEMSTGRKAFSGASQASLVTAIMSKEPESISSVVAMSPPALDRLVATCLAKDPEERWQSARDVKNELSWIAQAGSKAGAPAVVVSRRKNRERLAWAVAAAATFAAAAIYLARPAPRGEEPLRRFGIAPPDKVVFRLAHAVSPDGRWIVLDGDPMDGARRLYLRAIDTLEPRLLAGTEGASFPFWSPDSRSVAFFADGRLRRLDIATGSLQTICDAPQGRGGSWGRDGTILVTPDLGAGLFRVPATGGSPVALTSIDKAKGETSHRFPQFLPDGRHFLYYVRTSGTEKEWIYSGSLDSRERRPLLQAASSVVYTPDGYLLFVREGNLLAQRFDASRLELSGEPVVMAESMNYLGSSVPDGYAAFSAAKGGILTFRGSDAAALQLRWFDRSGKALGTVGPEAGWDEPAMSRDGKRLIVSKFDQKSPQDGVNLWAIDLSRGTLSRLTFGSGTSVSGVWSPDGSDLVFARQKSRGFDLYRTSTTGATPEARILSSDSGAWPDDWSRDGGYLLYESTDPKTRSDLWVMPMKGGGKPFPYIQAPFDQGHGQFSPDGRFVAYTSNESGREEVYVQTFPRLTGKWQISTAGGDQPYWRADGRELFYMRLDRTLMSVDVKTGAGFEAALPVVLFETRAQTVAMASSRNHYVVSDDGQRFLVNTIVDRVNHAPIQVVLNWTAAMKKP